MITRNDIVDFFNTEAEYAKQNWESFMELPIKERVRKRKAIENVYLDKEFGEDSKENYRLLKLHFTKNLADFKEGDPVLLHAEGAKTGIKCNIHSFDNEDNIITIEVFPRNLPGDLSTYYDITLSLDRDLVDLRPNVYSHFTSVLPMDTNFWEKHIVNTKAKPTFRNIEECETELEDTITNFELDLLPKQREAVLKSMATEDYYMIQGPPGTGKSFVLALVILEELLYFKHKIIVVGPNHLAINNALIKVAETAPFCLPYIVKVGQEYNAPAYSINTPEGEEMSITKFTHLNGEVANSMEGGWIIGLTPHSLYTSRARRLECDTLIIDEAGQMTIPLALMGMIKAKKVIFAGDYKQLSPIVSSTDVPEIMSQSIFQRLATNENCTMLDFTFRMCEPICNLVSELFYDGQVKSRNKGCDDKILCNDPLYSFDHPIILHNICDVGTITSDEEADFISKTIEHYLELGLTADKIAVLAPFRAQAANIKRALRSKTSINEDNRKNIAIDTVDKMQGQERDVIIFSLTAGDPAYLTEMADFLYNPNKLNVAFSRAKYKLIIVGNLENLSRIDEIKFSHIKSLLSSQYAENL